MDSSTVGNLKIDVIEWKKSAVDDKIILFIIEIKKRDGDKWQIEKRY